MLGRRSTTIFIILDSKINKFQSFVSWINFTYKMIVSKINPGNEALEFIDLRIQNNKYRGAPSSEHNRYVMSQIITILMLLDKYAPQKRLMTIRTTDISKRSENKPDEFVYARFCNEAKQKA